MAWVLVEEEHFRGSSDPIVARTTMQAGNLVKLFGLTKEDEMRVIQVFDKFRRHLHQCDEIANRVIAEIEEKGAGLTKKLDDRKEGEVLRLPAVKNLTNDIETFLYHAKLALRELKVLFQYTQGKSFKATTQYDHIADWSRKRFGPDNQLTTWLTGNCDWINKLIESRNAVEHPERQSLEIRNIHLQEDNGISGPTWSLNGEEPKSILADLSVIPMNLIQFAEILLIYSLSNIKNISPMIIAEIPENKRNKVAPVRFIATLEQELDENGRYKRDLSQTTE